ncbi:MAG TPA: serine hydrolase domain-containing protein [Phenylobacterium sp.]|nr:serine hydrolase domain-containing protein [Phenylobacterium sp.]
MRTNRRSLILLGAAVALPGPALAAWPLGRAKPAKGCKGRAAYGGGPLRAQVDAATFDTAAKVGSTRATPYASDDLDSRLEKTLAATKSQTLTAAVARSDGTLWTQTLAASGGPPAPASFEWPGLAEVYVATAVLQLVEEKKLALDATIERWAPEIATARWISVQDLLGHTSGLAGPLPGQAVPASPYCPGAGWSSADADYRLLIRIVEALDGRGAVARRTIEALDLKETKLSVGSDLTPPTLTASAADVVRFWRALLADRLHSAQMTRQRFQRLYPMTAAPVRTWWGLGVTVTDLAADPWNPADTWLGHTGARPGVSAVVAYSPRRRAVVAVALTGQGSAQTAIDLLLLGVEPDPTALNFTPRPPRPAKRPRRPPAKSAKRPNRR